MSAGAAAAKVAGASGSGAAKVASTGAGAWGKLIMGEQLVTGAASNLKRGGKPVVVKPTDSVGTGALVVAVAVAVAVNSVTLWAVSKPIGVKVTYLQSLGLTLGNTVLRFVVDKLIDAATSSTATPGEA